MVFLLTSIEGDSRLPSDEAAAISSIQNIVTSQITYSSTTGGGSYSPDLRELVTGNLIDSVLGSGTMDGYTFVVNSDSPETSKVVARPVQYGTTGCRCFLADETGVIRYTRKARAATVKDPPIGQ